MQPREHHLAEPDVLVKEADVLAEAIQVMSKYRGGLSTVLAVIAETETALRLKAQNFVEDATVRDRGES